MTGSPGEARKFRVLDRSLRPPFRLLKGLLEDLVEGVDALGVVRDGDRHPSSAMDELAELRCILRLRDVQKGFRP